MISGGGSSPPVDPSKKKPRGDGEEIGEALPAGRWRSDG